MNRAHLAMEYSLGQGVCGETYRDSMTEASNISGLRVSVSYGNVAMHEAECREPTGRQAIRPITDPAHPRYVAFARGFSVVFRPRKTPRGIRKTGGGGCSK